MAEWPSAKTKAEAQKTIACRLACWRHFRKPKAQQLQHPVLRGEKGKEEQELAQWFNFKNLSLNEWMDRHTRGEHSSPPLPLFPWRETYGSFYLMTRTATDSKLLTTGICSIVAIVIWVHQKKISLMVLLLGKFSTPPLPLLLPLLYISSFWLLVCVCVGGGGQNDLRTSLSDVGCERCLVQHRICGWHLGNLACTVSIGQRNSSSQLEISVQYTG